MEKVKDILFIILGFAIAIAIFWFFFFVALPVLFVLGLIAFLFFMIKGTDFFQKIKKKVKKKVKKQKDDIQEAQIIEEKEL